MSDPFPFLTKAGTWQTIHSGHKLIYLGGDVVLDWVPATGGYRVWNYTRTIIREGDPLPGPPVVQGTWQTINSGHELIYLGRDKVLDWVPATGEYRIWNYDRNVTGNGDPFPGQPVVKGTWKTIGSGHRLISLSTDRVLDWVPATGEYRIWNYDRNVTGNGDPFPGQPVVKGTWKTVGSGHELISLSGDRVLDWVPSTGEYRVWRYDRNVTGDKDPLPGPALASGTWQTIISGHKLINLMGDRVLDWEPGSGEYRIWRYDRSDPRIFSLKMHAINVNNTQPNKGQVTQWVETANKVFAPAGVVIEFDSNEDWEEVSDPILNGLDGKDYPEADHKARAIANTHRDKIVVFFRSGGTPGQSYSSHAAPYIAMTSYSAAQSEQSYSYGPTKKGSIKRFSHELGHYLGIPHTFPSIDYSKHDNPKDAVIAFLKSAGSKTADALDGDRAMIMDTPPDPLDAFFIKRGWNPGDVTKWVRIRSDADGIDFTLNPDRYNVMSYWNCNETYRISNDQCRRIREKLFEDNRIELIEQQL